MKKKTLFVSLLLVFCLFTSNMVFSIFNIDFGNGFVFAATFAPGGCDCEVDAINDIVGGEETDGCRLWYDNSGPEPFKCCTSTGAAPEASCQCAFECNTPYNEDPCDPPPAE